MYSTVKSFYCDIYSHDFAMNVQLQMHLVTHTEERLFTCRICGRSYTVNSSLLAHLKTHTAEEVRKQALQSNPQVLSSVTSQPPPTTTTPSSWRNVESGLAHLLGYYKMTWNFIDLLKFVLCIYWLIRF